MHFLKFFTLLGLALTCGHGLVSAGTMQTVRFAQAPVLITWDEAGAQQTGPAITLQPQASLQPETLRGSGMLTPVPASFNTNAAQAGEMRFRVASNTGFTIEAILMTEYGPIDTPVTITALNTGSKAARPRLSQKAANLFEVANKTAALPGAPIDQSIEYVASWDTAIPAQLTLELSAN